MIDVEIGEDILLEDGIELIYDVEPVDVEDFFYTIENKPEGLELTIKEIEYVDNENFKLLHLNYIFETSDELKKLTRSHYIRKVLSDGRLQINRGERLFQILKIAIPEAKRANKVRLTEEKLEEKLIGFSFICKRIKEFSMDEGFISYIEPVELGE